MDNGQQQQKTTTSTTTTTKTTTKWTTVTKNNNSDKNNDINNNNNIPVSHEYPSEELYCCHPSKMKRRNRLIRFLHKRSWLRQNPYDRTSSRLSFEILHGAPTNIHIKFKDISGAPPPPSSIFFP